MYGPKVFSVTEESSVVTWLSRVKFMRITDLKSLAVCTPNDCEAFRATLILLHSRGDKQDKISAAKLVKHILFPSQTQIYIYFW